jgi:hypothetical protein
MKYLIATALLIAPLAFAESTHSFAICEPNTQCSKCIERATFSLRPDFSTKSVTYKGMGPDGIPQMGKVVDCEFKDIQNWVCKDGRALMTSVSGKVTMSYLGPPPIVNGRQQEVCLK